MLDSATLLKTVGIVVRMTGHMIDREHTFTHQELTDMRDSLNHSAEAIQTIRDTLYPGK